MGADWSVTFVSNDEQEVLIPVDVLCSASTVWRERLQLTQGSIPCASAENCDAEGLRAFVSVISAHSQDVTASMKQLPVATLTKALYLVHKYDCTGVKRTLDDLDGLHVPDDGVKIFPHKIYSFDHSCIIHDGRTIYLTEPWLTQELLDYLILKQELYAEQNKFPESVKKLLAGLLTRKHVCDRALLVNFCTDQLKMRNPFVRSIHVKVELNQARGPSVESLSSPADKYYTVSQALNQARGPNVESLSSPADKYYTVSQACLDADVSLNSPLVVPGWRLTASTLTSLIPYMAPNFS